MGNVGSTPKMKLTQEELASYRRRLMTAKSKPFKTTRLLLKKVISDREHIICDCHGVNHLRIQPRGAHESSRRVCDLDGRVLWQVMKRPEGTFELIPGDDMDQPTVVYIFGTTQNPKLFLRTPPSHPHGKRHLKVKGDIMKRDFLIKQLESSLQDKKWVTVASSNPTPDGQRHFLCTPPGIDFSMMAAICVVISELELLLSLDLSGLRFNPPVAVFGSKFVSQKKTVLTPIVINGVVAVTDCEMNTIVFRDAQKEGKGLFLDTHGDIVFNFEQRGKLLCIPLKKKSGPYEEDFLVFSVSKAYRGVSDILVSRVRSLSAMDRKDIRKDNCFLTIRVDSGASDPVVYKTTGRPNRRFNGQPMGKMLTAARSPDAFCNIFRECTVKADPKGNFNVKHMGLSGVFPAGVDLALASALTLGTLMLLPKLGQPSNSVPLDIMSRQVQCSHVLNLDQFE